MTQDKQNKQDKLDRKIVKHIKPKFLDKYVNFNKYLKEYEELPDFKISENVESVGGISEQAHYIMRLVTQYHMENVFKSMKIDMSDVNVTGEKGTPYRFTKMYCGSDLEDDTELLSGRWANRPDITAFDENAFNGKPITKKVDIVSVCSHHTAPFSTMFREDSYAIVSYIPNEKVLGISKLQRLVDWVARRGQLQEGLTKMIYDEICKDIQSDNVYVKLCNVMHTCEKLRGAQSQDGSFTSEYYGGVFEDRDVRKEVQESIK
jgi:GTP cyclohydrolase I